MILDKIDQIRSSISESHLAHRQKSAKARADLRGLLDGQYIAYKARIETWPKDIWGIVVGKFKSLRIERGKIVIMCTRDSTSPGGRPLLLKDYFSATMIVNVGSLEYVTAD